MLKLTVTRTIGWRCTRQRFALKVDAYNYSPRVRTSTLSPRAMGSTREYEYCAMRMASQNAQTARAQLPAPAPCARTRANEVAKPFAPCTRRALHVSKRRVGKQFGVELELEEAFRRWPW